MDFDKIKLIIWDLDETFWQGTLSEEKVFLSEKNINLIKNLTDFGVVNSICSKNDENNALQELEKYGLNDYFVFNSINWNPKGSRIKNIIKEMQLRAPNVLFIDDNPSNLEEAKYFCPEIMTSTPEIIDQLIKWVEKKTPNDLLHKRLNQYKILQKKSNEKANFDSNESFLKSSNIKLEIKNDCECFVDRIQELVMRSNQLNFTKKRDSVDDLLKLFNDDSYNCGYVLVRDNFGDYGLVGFFAVKDNKCEHFLFSCRTLGMGIEQYVYNYLNRPELDIVGEIASDLSLCSLPAWINQDNKKENKNILESVNIEKNTILFKGPCDLYQIFPFIQKSDCIDTDFTYTMDNGTAVESTAHTTHIVEAARLTIAQKKMIVDELPFMDIGVYSDNVYSKPYKVIILSLLQDFNLGVYRRKETGEKFAFLEYTSDLTNVKNYDKLINKKCNVCNYNFTESFLREFSKKYEFVGRNSPTDILENVKYIRKNMPKDCALVLMLGTETPYDMKGNPAYEDRHLVHKEFNTIIRDWSQTQSMVELIDVNKYITGPECYYDHINHFIKPIYYSMAKDIVTIINKYTKQNISETSRAKVYYMRFHDFIGNTLSKIKNKGKS